MSDKTQRELELEEKIPLLEAQIQSLEGRLKAAEGTAQAAIGDAYQAIFHLKRVMDAMCFDSPLDFAARNAREFLKKEAEIPRNDTAN